MIRGSTTLHIPNPHQADIGRDLLVRILRQAGVAPSGAARTLLMVAAKNPQALLEVA